MFAIPILLLPVLFFSATTAILLVFRMLARDHCTSDADLRQFSVTNAVCYVCIVQKVERRLDRLSNGSLPWLEGVVSPLLQRYASIFSSHRRTGTGEVSLLIRSHVACVKNMDK